MKTRGHTCEGEIEQDGQIVVCGQPAERFFVSANGKPLVYCTYCFHDMNHKWVNGKPKRVFVYTRKIDEVQYLILRIMDS